jgi:hypothetical protein
MFSEIQTTFLTFFPPKKIVLPCLELVFKRMVVNKKAFWLGKVIKEVICEPNYSHFKIRACAETGKPTFLRHPKAPTTSRDA